MQDTTFTLEDGIAIITINRPHVRNALRSRTLQEMRRLLKTIRKDRASKVVIVTGAGGSFSSGADIKEMKEINASEARRFALLAGSTFREIADIPKPFIAAVNGHALGGGCDLALVCDLCVASEDAIFGEPTASLGIITSFGGTYRLAKIVGIRKAKELFLLGRTVDASEAFQIGLVNKVVKREELLVEAKRMAEEIKTKAPLAIASIKRLITRSSQLNSKAASQEEVTNFAKLFRTKDQKEGMSAFLEKRRPRFVGE